MNSFTVTELILKTYLSENILFSGGLILVPLNSQS